MPSCLLCGCVTNKFAKSHIIPKSLYSETIKSKAGPARIISNDEGQHPKRSPNGVYDETILCIPCEESLSPLDDYANEFLLNSKPDEIIRHNGESLAEKYQKVDIENLSQFFVSLIWRMEATNHDMFKGVKLGPYKEKVKTALISKDPKLVPEMDVVISRFDDALSVGFLGPLPMRIEGINGYRVSFAYHACWVKIDKRPFPGSFKHLALSSGNPLHIMCREFDGSPERRAMAETVQSQSK